MGGYPPGTDPSDPNAPWNAPDPSDVLPLVCQYTDDNGDTCGFTAETMDEVDDHEHQAFRPPEPDPPDYCVVCHPPPDMAGRHKHDALVFCDHHDRDDYRTKLDRVTERHADARERKADADEHRCHRDDP